MSRDSEFQIRWLALGKKARQVYSLPKTIPWPAEMPAPAPDDYFVNMAALGAAAEAAGSDRQWEELSRFCRLCEEASEATENFEYEKALGVLQDAEELRSCAFVHWQRCICHLELKQPEQALAAAYHATTLSPQCGVFWRVFGELCQERGMPKEAKEAFQKAFFGGEQSPSVIAAMKVSGMLVPAPGGGGSVLVSPAVASAILAVHISSVAGRAGGEERLRELASVCLENRSTAATATLATDALLSGGGGHRDKLMHAEGLWSKGKKAETCRILESLAGGDSVGGVDHRALQLFSEALPDEFSRLADKAVETQPDNAEVVREVFRHKGLSWLENFARRDTGSGGWIVLSEEFSRLKRRKEAVEAAERAAKRGGSGMAAAAAKVLVENREYEKACAVLSKIPERERGGFASFLFAESLWQMGFPELAAPVFGAAIGAGGDEGLVQNAQMRRAQCLGFLVPLPEQATLSPTKRLGRPLLVSNPEQEWTSVVAPAGLPSSSYVRIKTERELGACEYRVFEFSRQKGELCLGEFSLNEKHDEIALAIEPTGKIFVGAKRGGEWVRPALGGGA